MNDQQMIRNPWGISVYGADSVKAKPDLVRIRFRVARVEKDPTAAFALVNEEVKAVREVLRRHGVPDSRVDRSRLDLKSDWEWNSNRRQFRGYQCQAQFTVESTELDGMQTLLIDLITAGANEIDAVDFDVTGKPELRARARNALLTEAIAQEERLETAQDLLELEGMTQELAAKLAERQVHTRDDLAELATDELAEIAGLTEQEASDLIMRARAHWFDEE